MVEEKLKNMWEKVTLPPDAKEQMLQAILKENAVSASPKTTRHASLKRLAALSLIAVLLSLSASYFLWWRQPVLVAQLQNQQAVRFYPTQEAVGAASFAADVVKGGTERPLTAPELRQLFGALAVTGLPAVFSQGDGQLLYFEGACGATKIILAAQGQPVTDIPVSGHETSQQLNQQKVTAGYTLMGANSQGVRTIIYFASFQTQELTVYLESAGPQAESAALRQEIAQLLAALTKNPPEPALLTK